MPPSCLSRSIVTSKRLASLFDWKWQSSSICGLLVSKKHISLAVVDHPYKEHRTLKKLFTIPQLNTLHGKEVLRKALENTLNKFNVIGFTVSWPLEDSGNPGAACGRTLNVLDFLADESNGSLINWNRPLVLLDQRIITNQPLKEIVQPTDSFGRSSAYCPCPGDITTSMHIHSSKNHLYDPQNTLCASLVVEQFLSHQYACCYDCESIESSDAIQNSTQYNLIDRYEIKRHESLLW